MGSSTTNPPSLDKPEAPLQSLLMQALRLCDSHDDDNDHPDATKGDALQRFNDTMRGWDDTISSLRPDDATLFLEGLLMMEEFVFKKFPNLKRGTSMLGDTTGDDDDDGATDRAATL